MNRARRGGARRLKAKATKVEGYTVTLKPQMPSRPLPPHPHPTATVPTVKPKNEPWKKDGRKIFIEAVKEDWMVNGRKPLAPSTASLIEGDLKATQVRSDRAKEELLLKIRETELTRQEERRQQLSHQLVSSERARNEFLSQLSVQSDRRYDVLKNQTREWVKKNAKKTELRKLRNVEPFNHHPGNREETRKLILQNFKERSVRVFVSSTYLDLRDERSYLVNHTFPKIRDVCSTRGLHFSEVDLRWGITKEQQDNGQVLTTCLNEIDQCRPHFIGIIGNRYGWAKGDKADPLLEKTFDNAIAAGHGWLSNYRDRSITEIEILYGTLFDPAAVHRHCFFYFDESPNKNYTAEDKKSEKKLHSLKDRVRRSGLPVRVFRSKTELGQMVFDDLQSSVDYDYPLDEPTLSEVEQNRYLQAAFRDSRSEVYVGQEMFSQLLSSHLSRSGVNPFVVFGEPGSGRSALISTWWKRLLSAQPDCINICYHVSAGSSTDSTDILLTIMNELKYQAPIQFGGLEIPLESATIREQFPMWLRMATCSNLPVYIVIDGIDEVTRGYDKLGDDEENESIDLLWLPEKFPESVRVILTTSESTRYLCAEREWGLTPSESFTIPPLDKHERIRLIHAYLDHFGKKLSENHVSVIASSDGASSALFLRALLDELRICGDYSRIGELVQHYSSADSASLLYMLIFSRWESTYEGDDGLEEGTVRKMLSLIWASRRGISETELLSILDIRNRSVWSPLFVAVKDLVVSREGLMRFFHQDIETAVRELYCPSKAMQISIREMIVDYFSSKSGDRKVKEYPYQLLRIGDSSMQSLRSYLSDFSVFNQIYKRSPLELLGFWRAATNNELSEVFEAYDQELYSYEDDEFEDEDYEHEGFICDGCGEAPIVGIRYQCNNCSDYDLCDLCASDGTETGDHLNSHDLDPIAPPREFSDEAIRIASTMVDLGSFLSEAGVLSGARDILERAVKKATRIHGNGHPLVATAMYNLALLLQKQGEFDSASFVARKSLNIREKLLGSQDKDTIASVCLLALLRKKKGDYDVSENLYRAGLENLEQQLGLEHPQYNIQLQALGDVLRKKAVYQEASEIYTVVLANNRKNFGNDHPIVADALNALGLVMKKVGKYEAAHDIYEEAVRIVAGTLGEKHPKYAEYLNNHADILRKQAKFHEALEVYDRVLEIQLVVLDDNHPDVAETYNAMSLIQKKLGKYDVALKLEDHALNLIASSLGAEHPKYALFLHHKGDIFRKISKRDDALACYQLAYTLNSADNILDEAGWNQNGIGLVYLAEDMLPEAETALNHAKDAFETYFGKEHPKYAQVLNNLGILYKVKKQYNLARELYEQAKAINERQLGPQHPEVAENMSNLAIVLKKQGNFELAEQYHREALAMVQSSYGNEDSAVKAQLYIKRYEKTRMDQP